MSPELFLEGRRDPDAHSMVQPIIRKLSVHLHALGHVGQLLLTALVNNFLDLGHGHFHQFLMDLVIGADRVFFLKKDFMISLGQNNVGVSIPYLADADACSGDDLCPGVKLRLAVVDHHNHMAGLRQLNGLLRDRLVNILQKLQALVGIAQAGPQGCGVFQANAVKTGDPHAHAVFINAGIYLHFHGHNISSYGMVGIRSGKGNAHRLCTAKGRDYLLAE